MDRSDQRNHRIVFSCIVAGILLLSVSILTLVSYAEIFPPVIGVSGTSGDDVIELVTPVTVTSDETMVLGGILGVSAAGIDSQSGDDQITTAGDGFIAVTTDAVAIVGFTPIQVIDLTQSRQTPC